MLEFLVDALAAFRLTRLVVADDITEEIRGSVLAAIYAAGDREPPEGVGHIPWTRAVGLDPDPPKLARLLTCPWCSGVWVAFGVAVLSRVLPRSWRAVARPLALSSVAGILGSRFE